MRRARAMTIPGPARVISLFGFKALELASDNFDYNLEHSWLSLYRWLVPVPAQNLSSVSLIAIRSFVIMKISVVHFVSYTFVSYTLFCKKIVPIFCVIHEVTYSVIHFFTVIFCVIHQPNSHIFCHTSWCYCRAYRGHYLGCLPAPTNYHHFLQSHPNYLNHPNHLK